VKDRYPLKDLGNTTSCS